MPQAINVFDHLKKLHLKNVSIGHHIIIEAGYHLSMKLKKRMEWAKIILHQKQKPLRFEHNLRSNFFMRVQSILCLEYGLLKAVF